MAIEQIACSERVCAFFQNVGILLPASSYRSDCRQVPSGGDVQTAFELLEELVGTVQRHAQEECVADLVVAWQMKHGCNICGSCPMLPGTSVDEGKFLPQLRLISGLDESLTTANR